MNERIRAREVRVVDDAGNQLGVMTLLDAMKTARESGLDVVEISPDVVATRMRLSPVGATASWTFPKPARRSLPRKVPIGRLKRHSRLRERRMVSRSAVMYQFEEPLLALRRL